MALGGLKFLIVAKTLAIIVAVPVVLLCVCALCACVLSSRISRAEERFSSEKVGYDDAHAHPLVGSMVRK